jgi:hypothetical protein
MDIIEQLHADYIGGQVCLFVGAGVSIDSGLPDWKGLAKQVIDSLPKKPDPPLGARAAAISKGQQPPPDPNALSFEKAEVLSLQDPIHSMRYARSVVSLI